MEAYLERFVGIIKSVDIPFWHMYVPENTAMPYMVYTDYTERYFRADDSIDDVAGHIQLDYYTKAEYDQNKGKIRRVFDEAGIVFDYRCMREGNENVYHHIFDCEVW